MRFNLTSKVPALVSLLPRFFTESAIFQARASPTAGNVTVNTADHWRCAQKHPTVVDADHTGRVDKTSLLCGNGLLGFHPTCHLRVFVFEQPVPSSFAS